MKKTQSSCSSVMPEDQQRGMEPCFGFRTSFADVSILPFPGFSSCYLAALIGAFTIARCLLYDSFASFLNPAREVQKQRLLISNDTKCGLQISQTEISDSTKHGGNTILQGLYTDAFRLMMNLPPRTDQCRLIHEPRLMSIC